MKSRRNVFAAVALLAVLSAGPAAADWDIPSGDIPVEDGLGDVCLVAQWGFEILQVAL